MAQIALSLVTSPAIPRALGRVHAGIFWFVAWHPEGVTRMEIFDHLYGDREDGGPFDKCLDTHLCHLNTKLARYGLVIRKEIPRKHKLKYNLRRLDNGNIWLPKHTTV
jgi:hypothetical protein